MGPLPAGLAPSQSAYKDFHLLLMAILTPQSAPSSTASSRMWDLTRGFLHRQPTLNLFRNQRGSSFREVGCSISQQLWVVGNTHITQNMPPCQWLCKSHSPLIRATLHGPLLGCWASGFPSGEEKKGMLRLHSWGIIQENVESGFRRQMEP